MSSENSSNSKQPDKGGQPRITLHIQTPRGLWSMHEPEKATIRPEYPISTKIDQLIRDARAVFGFVEEDSKYTLLREREVLVPERTIASYQLADGTLLILSVQGGNA